MKNEAMGNGGKPSHNPNKKTHKMLLLDRISAAIAEGMSPSEAVSQLSVRQYDLLIDNGVNLDDLLLSKKQIAAFKEVIKSPRPLFPSGYLKKYPEEKRKIYQSLIEWVEGQGYLAILPEKENFRDLKFEVEGTLYKIVLSQPRTEK
jgi:hypothetical protein